MYVAQRELKVISRGENPITKVYSPGDVIPDFEDWDIHARRAHLNLEWVIKEEDEKSPSKSEERRLKVVKESAEKQAGSKKKADKTDLVKCGKCDKEFKSAKAAKTHATLAHK